MERAWIGRDGRRRGKEKRGKERKWIKEGKEKKGGFVFVDWTGETRRGGLGVTGGRDE